MSHKMCIRDRKSLHASAGTAQRLDEMASDEAASSGDQDSLVGDPAQINTHTARQPPLLIGLWMRLSSAARSHVDSLNTCGKSASSNH